MKSPKKILITMSVLVVVLIVLIIVSNIISDKNNTLKDDTVFYDKAGNEIDFSNERYNTLKDKVNSISGLSYKNAISNNDSEFVADIYVTIQKALTIENEVYFNSYVENIAYQLDYNSFKLIDEKNNISIEVYGDSINRKIEKVIINNQENYFVNLRNKQQLEDYTETPTVDIEVQSVELNKILNANWKIETILKENPNTSEIPSEANNLELFSNVKVDVYKGMISRVTFESLYANEILSNLKTNCAYEEMTKSLGEPYFKDSLSDVYGYKTEKFYVFFSQDEISIYRIDKVDDNVLGEAIKILRQNGNVLDFFKKVYSEWQDYDYLYYKENDFSIRYTLKGVVVQNIESTSPKIVIYSNYEGIVENGKYLKDLENLNLPAQIYLKLDDNLIFEQECSRCLINIAE